MMMDTCIKEDRMQRVKEIAKLLKPSKMHVMAVRLANKAHRTILAEQLQEIFDNMQVPSFSSSTRFIAISHHRRMLQKAAKVTATTGTDTAALGPLLVVSNKMSAKPHPRQINRRMKTRRRRVTMITKTNPFAPLSFSPNHRFPPQLLQLQMLSARSPLEVGCRFYTSLQFFYLCVTLCSQSFQKARHRSPGTCGQGDSQCLH
jgi:hypothetical protein